MAGMDWFRWHHGSVTDPKFQLVARKSGASLPDVLAVWAFVLEAASQSGERGTFEVDAEALDCLFDFPNTQTRTADILKAMEGRGLVKDGRICAWEKRQPKRERPDDNSTERVKALRGRERHGTPRNAKDSTETPRVEKSREEEKETPPYPPQAGGDGGGDVQSPTKAGAICKAIRAKGIADVNPSSPELLALIAKGVPVETFEAAAEICAKATPPKGFAYMLGIVKRQLGEAAAIASGAGMPAKPWDESRATIEAKAEELGLGRWDESDLSIDRETFQQFTARVRQAVQQTGHSAPAGVH